jgi:transcriptional regulator with XRE-family HTH domain
MIRKKRLEKGLLQSDLAKRSAGVADQGAISRLETGFVADPSSKLIFYVGRALDIPVDVLLSELCSERPRQKRSSAVKNRSARAKR